MLRFATAGTAFLFFAVSSATGGTLSATKWCSTNAYQLYLHSESTQFDSISVNITASSGSFENLDSGFNGFIPRRAGDAFSFINRYLAIPPAVGGNGLTLVGVVLTPTQISFDATNLDGLIDTNDLPGGRVLLANLLIPETEARVTVSLVDGGNLAQTLTLVRSLTAPDFPCVPEPSAALLAVLGIATASAGEYRVSRTDRKRAVPAL